MSNEELKPCPFCGGNAEEDNDEYGVHWISCNECGARSAAEVFGRDTIAAKWNTRAQQGDVTRKTTVQADGSSVTWSRRGKTIIIHEVTRPELPGEAKPTSRDFPASYTPKQDKK